MRPLVLMREWTDWRTICSSHLNRNVFPPQRMNSQGVLLYRDLFGFFTRRAMFRERRRIHVINPKLSASRATADTHAQGERHWVQTCLSWPLEE